ncbi:MAG: histidine phosphatase family protein [Gammaproteobacteria bacterium]|nr:histidine phosphatase family protein [Gammaproteobacteria bacterium]
MRIHLIRHGQTDWNKERRVQGQSESTLTAEGRDQATALRARLSTCGIAKVYCSSSIRTRETAAILFAGTGLEVEYSDALREIFLGPWEGSLYADMEAKFPQSFADFWHRPDVFSLADAETFVQTQQRGVRELQRIIADAAAEDVAIVSHGVLIKSILSHVEGRPLARLWEPPDMHNCSHSIVEIERNNVQNQARPKITLYAGVDYAESVQ